ncbi:hypothetical protein [Polymorphospora rubra]|uniref:Uncharacterized protein n=1 Tax=Polymorphospora rubra TaxID=338584 RepID=A0A810MX15_9ACTN|nr:hypothetical protein [Polymorphospora rubra]BCJ65716.1 hypothetical protein Prubr_27370 [Polymorphospora rubra]
MTTTTAGTLPRRTATPSHQPAVVLPRPGDEVTIAACDYLGGNTAITVRVVDIDTSLNHLQLKALEWVSILAHDIDQPPTDIRRLVVRVAGLPPPVTAEATSDSPPAAHDPAAPPQGQR